MSSPESLVGTGLTLVLVMSSGACGDVEDLAGSDDAGESADGTDAEVDDDTPAEMDTGPDLPEAPAPSDDAYATVAEGTLSVAAADGVLANDVIEGEVELVTPVSTVAGGEIEVSVDGSFVYTPAPGAWGCDSFDYELVGPEASASATVHLTIGHPDRLPLQWLDAYGGGLAIDGEQANDRLGRVLAPAGDVDGDGYDDVLIGAPYASRNGFNDGAVYVVYGGPEGAGGATGPIDAAALAVGEGGFMITGATPSAELGNALAGVGDFDGDGLDDFVIGAWSTNLGGGPMGDVVGRSYVIFGGARTQPVSVAELFEGAGGGLAMTGEMMADFSGASVSGAGDVNGDGYMDVVVGAPAAPMAQGIGRSYVVFGGPSVQPLMLGEIEATQRGFWIDGELPGDRSGAVVRSLGDVDDDGYDDLAITAPMADASGVDSGRVYVVYGKADHAPVMLADVAAGIGGYAIDGESAGDQFGTAADAGGDVDGDGRRDLVIGAPGATLDGPEAGCVYLVYGGGGGGPVQQLLAADGALRLDGEAAGDRAGTSVAIVRDMDGDGDDELALGAWRATTDAALAGRVYLIHGEVGRAGTVDLSQLDAASSVTLDGAQAQDYAGYCVANAGDVDGDGLGDLLLGSDGADTAGPYAGRAYVVWGGPSCG